MHAEAGPKSPRPAAEAVPRGKVELKRRNRDKNGTARSVLQSPECGAEAVITGNWLQLLTLLATKR